MQNSVQLVCTQNANFFTVTEKKESMKKLGHIYFMKKKKRKKNKRKKKKPGPEKKSG